ncbi:tail protein X [Glaesserella parasuis]|uniref:tail protein X n=1 Tax=Glaesserella parasuis TaxID=738 RepID=UPI0004B3EF80|nr:tail protein X [Glaesserella parasuis]MDP0328733.1 tail protein X [Glaesserella parasuis]MDP0391313.1 tail protein X [Glaesserella parasuis]
MLAYRYYGDVGEISRLIDANPHIPFCEVLPMGQTLFVPVIAVKATSQADLPPWMQE